MGEAIWCNIKVKVPDTWNLPDQPSRYAPDEMVETPPEFIEMLGTHALINGEGPDIDERRDGWTIWMCNGEGNYGMQDDDVQAIIQFCLRNMIPFVAIEDAKYEWLGSYAFFDGKVVLTAEYAGENIVLAEPEYRQIVAESDDPAYIAQHIADHFDVGKRGLAGVSIDHLPTECPTEEESE